MQIRVSTEKEIPDVQLTFKKAEEHDTDIP